MNRRVIDSVAVNAVKSPEDKKILDAAIEEIGAGTLVTDYKTTPTKFDKSVFRLKPYTFMNTLNPFIEGFMKSPNKNCTITDSLGNKHTITLEAASVIKALVMARMTYPKVLVDAISNVIDSIDAHFTGQDTSKYTMIYDETGESTVTDKNTTDLIKSEVFKALKERGLNLT